MMSGCHWARKVIAARKEDLSGFYCSYFQGVKRALVMHTPHEPAAPGREDESRAPDAVAEGELAILFDP